MTNPVDKFGDWLTKLRGKRPILGWVLTIVSLPLVLALGVGFFLLMPMLSALASAAGLLIIVVMVVLWISVRMGVVKWKDD